MKSKNLLIAVVATAFALAMVAGCASAGNENLRKETEASVAQKLAEGKTTKAEVRSMFGSPDSTSFTDSGLEIWKYENTNMKSDAVNYIPVINLLGSSASGTKKELVIMFDTNNVVKRYSMSEAATSAKTGVFR